LEKPIGARKEARWLEAHDAALILESARTFVPDVDHGALPCIYPLLAAFLLTGGRSAEVLGLDVDDVSLQRKTITFRPNEWRRLMTGTSHRSLPLWPQIEEILRNYLMERERTGGVGRLLFPSCAVDDEDESSEDQQAESANEGDKASESRIVDFRKSLDTIAKRAGWKAGEIRSKMFRHTYCAARLQTLDRGHPVSPYTVGKEMGHGGTAMVERVYSHLAPGPGPAPVGGGRVQSRAA
jgi:integrase